VYDEYFGADEAMASLKAGLAAFGAQLGHWRIDWAEPARSSVPFSCPDTLTEWAESLPYYPVPEYPQPGGVATCAYERRLEIIRRQGLDPDTLTEEQTESIAYAAFDEYLRSLGTFNPETLKGHGSCVLTGTWADDSFLDGIRESFWHPTCPESDLRELLYRAIQSLLADAASDYEAQLNDAESPGTDTDEETESE
jgi:hypothetical protein